ncbi:NAD(P)H-quinone oxidoreductase (plasmid) [Cupriavidus sp. P-10]|uniref:NAD(P)H-quinone oxidoreductase n=1 Tax=Cupriavidus sp. P-10 TaxID=2027911 RepID=UPI000E2F5FB8|nr:NAD(P)H-quinone oxidoreductase [Cupriavidus sp. P-10]BDB29872.1 NAD(P)H-quinone oxidoreductase [Cupriavidus sp. P-10]
MQYISHVSGAGSDSLTLREGEIPVVQDHEVLIRVAYAGINRPDVLQRMGLYQPPASANPFLGLEVSGVVAQVGSTVTGWKVGDEVCALTHGGGYAEFCTVDARHCLPVPEGLSLAQAAALPENYITVWANLFATGLVESGKTVLVHGGSSGIGLTAIQLASEVGAKVLTTAGSSEKLDVCGRLGAQHLINYRTEDFNEVVDAATAGQGVDIVLDMVGGQYIGRNLRALALEGALVQIAFLEGSVVNIDLQPIMLKRLRVMGSTLRARTAESRAALIRGLRTAFWPALERGRCLPHIHSVIPLQDAAKAHALMESGAHIGKILLKVD